MHGMEHIKSRSTCLSEARFASCVSRASSFTVTLAALLQDLPKCCVDPLINLEV